MSIQTTHEYLKGKWQFKGQTEYGFDEIDLIIEDEVTLIKRLNGREFEHTCFSSKGFFVDDTFLFRSPYTHFFVKEASERSMICGEEATAKIGKPIWQVKLERSLIDN